MSVHGDLVDILNNANVADGGAYAEYLDEDSSATDYVIVRRTLRDPQMTLIGYGGITHDIFLFECWSTDKAEAIAIADRVVAALDVQTTYPIKQQEAAEAREEFTPEVMELMEPRQYSIWHA